MGSEGVGNALRVKFFIVCSRHEEDSVVVEPRSHGHLKSSRCVRPCCYPSIEIASFWPATARHDRFWKRQTVSVLFSKVILPALLISYSILLSPGREARSRCTTIKMSRANKLTQINRSTPNHSSTSPAPRRNSRLPSWLKYLPFSILVLAVQIILTSIILPCQQWSAIRWLTLKHGKTSLGVRS